MAQRKLEDFFIDATHEYQTIVRDLQTRLKQSVYEEILAFVQMKTDEAMEQVWGKLQNRYEKLNQLEESMPDEPTKEDQNQYLKEFFRLTDPSRVSVDLQEALKFSELEGEYLAFIEKMSTQEYGEIFNRYKYPSPFFSSLKQAILHDIDLVTVTLKTYTETIGKHALLLNDMNKSAKDKAFIKGGASLLGMLVGIPFAGAGVGALMGGNDQSKVNTSLNKVFSNWNTYIEQFNHFLKRLEDNYRLGIMTLYGGTLLRVNDQLKVHHFIFAELALVSGEYLLTITEDERIETEQWVKETTAGITTLIKQKRWKEAITVSMKLFQTVNQRPITARSELYEAKSTLYITHLYYYLAFQEALLEEYKTGHIETFYKTAKNLYSELLLIIQDKDIDQHFSRSGILLFRYVKEALKRGELDDLKIIEDYLDRVGDRWEREGPYIGEFAHLKGEIAEFKSFVIIEEFISKLKKKKTKSYEKDQDTKVKLKRKHIKELMKIDAEIGPSDELSQFLRSKYLRSILLPFGENTFKWKAVHKKKLSISLVAGTLLVVGLTFHKEVISYGKEQFSKLTWFQSEKVEFVPSKDPISHLKITTDYANVRTSPSLQAQIVHTVNGSDTLTFSNEEKQDEEGRTWYHIQLPDGREGWISSTITKKIEE